MTSQELQAQILQLPLQERWQLVQSVLMSIQQETTASISTANDASDFAHIAYRVGSSGEASPVIKGTRIRVQTLAIAANQWNWTPTQIAEEYELSETQVTEALNFYQAHKDEIDGAMLSEVALEASHV
ncbi:MAG: DUF433 domain-containing protein [Cyanobacteria bacterium J06621_11]